MHVVFDARSVTDHYPGIGRYGSGLTQALAKRREVQLTLLVDPRAENTFHTLPEVNRVSAPYGLGRLSQQWAIPGLLRRLRADVYHSPYYLMPYVLPCPAVVTLHDLIPLRVPGSHSALFRLIYRATHHLAARAARRIIAVSAATASDLSRLGIPARKVIVVPEGVGPEFHPRSATEIGSLRQRYGLPESFALYVGTNKPHKNLARLIEAWALLERPWPLVVAGREDPRYPQARDLARAAGAQVMPIGGVAEADLPVLYSAASLFIFPSLYEGFGLPVIEAMACGTPVVCSNTSSLPEVAGDAALLVDPLNTKELVAVLERALADHVLRQELRARRQDQAAKFSWERTARETLVVYQQVFGGQS